MIFKEPFGTLLSIMGEEVTGTPAGTGTATTFRAIVDTSFPNQEDHPGRGTRFAMATITVSADDWTPDDRDTFNFRGYNWEMAAEGWEESLLNENSTKVHKGSLVRLIS